MIDYHVHPDFSHDARGSVEEFCKRALALGLSEVCFTTHYEPDPARKDVEWVRVGGKAVPVASDWATHYFAAIELARRKFPNLVVLAGVEVGYEPGLEGMIHDLLHRYPFDFVLGAVHCLDSVCLTAHEELDQFKRKYAATEDAVRPSAIAIRQTSSFPLETSASAHRGAEAVASLYLHHLRAAAGSTLFDGLAHLDIYRKYIEPLFDERFGKVIQAGLPDVLKFIAKSGTGIEVNTSALRRGDPEPYPSTFNLRLAVAAGVQVFTVGSDAHKPEDLGTGLERAEAMLRDLGQTPARFRRRQPVGRSLKPDARS